MNQSRNLIFDPREHSDWIRNSALTPTPILLSQDVIRVYCGFRDNAGVSRIGYVDVAADDPFKTLKVSKMPCLDVGRNGCFDDNGVILGHVERRGAEFWMYYVGFQLVKKAKFLAFTGLAISGDGGEKFERFSEAPIIDRTHGGTTIRALHSIIKDGDGWNAWYAQGDGWEMIDGKPFPQYHIYQASSPDGIVFTDNKLVIDNDEVKGEYRIGRPSVFDVNGKRLMFFTKGTKTGTDYFPGAAIQNPEGSWDRKDALFPLRLSEAGWDSIHLCYPRFIEAKGRAWLFYNGNNMGFEGFGAAEVTEWASSGLNALLRGT